MDKQTVNIALLEDGRLRLKTGRVVTPENEVLCIRDKVIYFKVNRDLVVSMDIDEYFKWSLWAHKAHFSHGNTDVGTVAYDNGYEHRSVAALVMQTTKGQRVGYKNGNHCDVRRENLFIYGM